MNFKSENKEISLAERIGLIPKNQAYPISNMTVSRNELILMFLFWAKLTLAKRAGITENRIIIFFII